MLFRIDDFFCCENCQHESQCNQSVLIDREPTTITICDCFLAKEKCADDDLDCG